MAAPTYDLVRQNYDLSNPLQAVRFQKTSLDFMDAVRKDAFQGDEGLQLMDEFCTFVSSEHVWHLAQTVVPEFRSAPGPSTDEDVSKSGLAYMLRRSQLPMLPLARDDKNVLTSEEKMLRDSHKELRDRHKELVEYLFTGGKGKNAASPSVEMLQHHVL